MRKDPVLVAIGQKIREVRKAAGYSQEGFAVEVELDRTYYGGIERGERNVAVKNLARIAEALEVEVGSLFPSMKELGRLRRKT